MYILTSENLKLGSHPAIVVTVYIYHSLVQVRNLGIMITQPSINSCWSLPIPVMGILIRCIKYLILSKFLNLSSDSILARDSR